MKATEWAIVVSSASAAFTLTTMAVALKTYLRVKPKVNIFIEDHRMSPVAPKPRQQRDYRFRVRLANRGTMAIGVERIEVWCVHGKWWRREVRPRGGRWFQDPERLEPFGGLKHYVNVTATALMPGGAPPKFVYFSAVLTDGRTIHSDWLVGLPDLAIDIGAVPEPQPESRVRGWRTWLGRRRLR